MADELYYVQQLDKTFEALLDQPNFAPLLRMFKNDPELLFEVRKGNAIVYYMGGKICELTLGGRAPNKKIRCYIDPHYSRRGKRKNSEEAFVVDSVAEAMLEDLNSQAHRFDYAYWAEKMPEVKTCIAEHLVDHQNKERQKQQVLSKENNDFDCPIVILDTEYGVREKVSKSSKMAKVDMVGLRRSGEGKWDIALIELKVGYSSVKGNAGIADHIRDFEIILRCRRPDITESALNIFELKKRYGWLKNCPNTLELSGVFVAYILAYDLKTPGEKTQFRKRFHDAKTASGFDLFSILMNEEEHGNDLSFLADENNLF